MPHRVHSCTSPRLNAWICCATARPIALPSFTAVGSSCCLRHTPGPEGGRARLVSSWARSPCLLAWRCRRCCCWRRRQWRPPPSWRCQHHAGSDAYACRPVQPSPRARHQHPLTPGTSWLRSRATPLRCPQSGTRCRARSGWRTRQTACRGRSARGQGCRSVGAVELLHCGPGLSPPILLPLLRLRRMRQELNV